MTENEHTFLPLELQAVQDGHYVEINVFNSEGRLLAEHNYLGTVPNGEKLFDMFSFIVRACNVHDELLVALEDLLELYTDAVDTENCLYPGDDIAEARAAIAKARGEQ